MKPQRTPISFRKKPKEPWQPPSALSFNELEQEEKDAILSGKVKGEIVYRLPPPTKINLGVEDYKKPLSELPIIKQQARSHFRKSIHGIVSDVQIQLNSG